MMTLAWPLKPSVPPSIKGTSVLGGGGGGGGGRKGRRRRRRGWVSV